MASLADIRKQYPEYSDVDDGTLAAAFHRNFYSDMPFENFAKAIGYQPPRGLLAETGASLARGGGSLAQLLSATAGERGVVSPETAASGVVFGEKLQRDYPPSEDVAKGLSAIVDSPDWWSAIYNTVTNPAAVAQMGAQSLVTSTPSILGGIAGAPGGPAGIAAGVGAGSFLVEYGSSVGDVMRKHGVDMADQKQVAAAFLNPTIMAEARDRGIKRGVPVALFDAASGAVAGKLVSGAKGAASFAKRAVGELGVQGVLGGAGEAGGQIATEGSVTRPGEVAAEFAAEVFPGGVPEIVTGTYARRQPTSPMAAAAESQAPEPPPGIPLDPREFQEPATGPLQGVPEPPPSAPMPGILVPPDEYQPVPAPAQPPPGIPSEPPPPPGEYESLWERQVPAPLSPMAQAMAQSQAEQQPAGAPPIPVGNWDQVTRPLQPERVSPMAAAMAGRPVAQPQGFPMPQRVTPVVQTVIPEPTQGPLAAALAQNEAIVRANLLGRQLAEQQAIQGEKLAEAEFVQPLTGFVQPKAPASLPESPAPTPGRPLTIADFNAQLKADPSLGSNPQFIAGMRAALATAKATKLPTKTPDSVASVGNSELKAQTLIEPAKPGEGIEVFHGSPHTFTKFDRNKLGTGGGYATEGRGLYFTDSEDYAAQYKTDSGAVYKARINIDKNKIQDWDKPIKFLDKKMRDNLTRKFPELMKDENRRLSGLYYKLAKDLDVDGAEHGFAVDKARDAFVEAGITVVRRKFSGANNYTVFNDSLIEIISRNGKRQVEAAKPVVARPTPVGETQAPLPSVSETQASAAGRNKPVELKQSLEPEAKVAGRNKPSAPLADFLASTGGIAVADRGETSMEGAQWMIPKAGPLWRAKAKGLDYARERAIEGGYLRPGSTVEDLVRALDRDRAAWKAKDKAGRVYPGGEIVEDTGKTQDEEQARLETRLEEVRAHSAEKGYELSDREMRSIAETMLTENMDASDATDRFIENDAEDVDAEHQDNVDQGEDIPLEPFGEQPPADEGAAPQARRASDTEPGKAAVTEEPGAEGLPQLVLPGMERSAKQAMAARDAAGPKAGQKPANEGLFAEREKEQAVMELPAKAAPKRNTDKLRATAQRAIDAADEDLSRDRLANTARRARMAAGATENAETKKQDAETLLRIADVIDEGEAGALANVSSLKDVERLRGDLYRARYARWRAENTPSGQQDKYAPYVEADAKHGKRDGAIYIGSLNAKTIVEKLKGKRKHAAALRDFERLARDERVVPTDGLAEAAAAADEDWLVKRIKDQLAENAAYARMGITDTPSLRRVLADLVEAIAPKKKTIDPIRTRIQEAARMNIPGYFPTPKPLIEEVIAKADIKPGMRVLEPEAGTGDLALAAKEAGGEVDTAEISSTLSAILKDRGMEPVASDLMKMEGESYDRIVMNPPFERGQDMEHVRKAYELLRPGGRVVAIMSEGPFFRQDKKATEFREWLESVNGESEKNPEGSFKTADRSTGVATRTVVIDKPDVQYAVAPTAYETPGSPEYRAAVAKGLDMSQAARMQRAREMGFDTETPLYHGTTAAFKSFSTARGKRLNLGSGIYLTPSASLAENFAVGEKGNLIPVFVSANNMFSVTTDDALRLLDNYPTIINSVRRNAGAVESLPEATAIRFANIERKKLIEAKDKGPRYERLALSDFVDKHHDMIRQAYDGLKWDNEIVVFDPRNIRSTQAAFDPANADSANLLASVRPSFTPAFARDRSAIVAEATKLAKTINPAIRLEAVDRILDISPEAFAASGGGPGMEAVASFSPAQGLIRVALSLGDREFLAASAHESFHSIEKMLPARDVALLNKAFPASGTRAQNEEVAYAFQDYLAGKPRGNLAARGVFARIKQFLQRLGNLLRGRGFQSVEDVFERALAGEYAPKMQTVDVRGTPVWGMPLGKEGAAISAWHGGPHRFDRFDFNKIGTGEGAQAYGHGGYFAENQKVGQDYREKLAKPVRAYNTFRGRKLTTSYIAKLANDSNENVARLFERFHIAGIQPTTNIIQYLQRQIRIHEIDIASFSEKRQRIENTPNWKGFSSQHYLDEEDAIRRQIAAVEELLSEAGHVPEQLGGALYKVTLDVNQEDLLDWDKPLSEQSAKVREALEELGVSRVGQWRAPHPKDEDQVWHLVVGKRSAGEYYTRLSDGKFQARNGRRDIKVFSSEEEAKQFVEDGIPYDMIPKGESVYATLGSSRKASAALLAAGIPGIKYLDGTSRKAGEGTYNYVIFDDKLVSIDDVQYAVAPVERPDWMYDSEPSDTMGRIKDATFGNTYRAARDWWMNEGITQLVDRFQPVLQLGRRLMPTDPGFMHRLTEFAANDAGAIQATMEAGAPIYDKAEMVMKLKPGSKGLVEIMTAHLLGETNTDERQRDAYRAGAYRIGQRAQRLKAEGRENLLSNADIAKALDVTPDEKKRYDAMWKGYDEHNNAVLQFLVDAGVIKQDAKDQWAAYGDYVPFYRVMEEDGELIGPAEYRSGISNPDPKIKKLKGGTSKLGDPFENIARNERALISSGRRNIALREISTTMIEAGEARFVPMTGGDTKNTILVYEDGQKKRLQVDDPAVAASLLSLGPQQTNGILQLLQKFAQIYRAGVTLSPSFAIANMLRDTPSAFIQTGANVTLKNNPLTNLAGAYNGSPELSQLRAITGYGGTVYGSEGRFFEPSLAEVVGTKRVGKLKQRARQTHDFLENVSQTGEWAGRMAIYKNMVDRGETEAAAAYEAMNVINFSRHGASPALRALTQMVPFLNARIVGLARMFETQGATFGSAERKKLIKALAFRGAILTAATIAIFGTYDDDDWERYNEESIARRANYHILYGPDGGELLIPKAFEFGTLFSTLPEAMYRAIAENHPGELGKMLKHTIGNTFNFNPTPQAMKPALEVLTNYNMFQDRELEPGYLKRFMPEERSLPNTSPIAQGIAKALPGGLSPIQVQHLIEGYTGAMGAAFLFGMDGLASAMGLTPERPTGAFGSFPGRGVVESVLGRFVKSGDIKPAEVSIQRIYELKEKADQAYTTARELMRRGEADRAKEIMEENKAPLMLRKQLDRAADDLAKYTKLARQVRYNRTMNADEKKARIDELTNQKNAIARRYMAMIDRVAA